MRRRAWSKVVAGLLFLAYFPTVAPAQQPPRAAGVVTALRGDAVVTRAALPQPQTLKFRDDVFGRDRISTRQDSLVRVLLGGKAVVTVRELSNLTITEEPGQPSIIDLLLGKIALVAARFRMTATDAIEIRTPNAVAAIRGTVGVVEVRPEPTASLAAAPTRFTETFHALSDILTICPPPPRPCPRPVQLGPGNSLDVVGGVIGAPYPSPPREVILAGLASPFPHTNSPPEFVRDVISLQQTRVDQVAAFVNGGSPSWPPPQVQQNPSTSNVGVQDCSSNPLRAECVNKNPAQISAELAAQGVTPAQIAALGLPLPPSPVPSPPPPSVSGLITFDPVFPSIPPGVTVQYFNGGFTGPLTALPAPNAIALQASGSAIPNGGNALLLTTGFGAPFGALVSFSSPQKTITAVGNDFGGDPVLDNEIVHLTAFDAGGNVIGSSTFASPFATPNLKPVLFNSPSKNIMFVAFTFQQDLGFYQVDDIGFVDPPYFPQLIGGSYSMTSSAALNELVGNSIASATDLVLLDAGSSLTLGGQLLLDSGGTYDVARRFVSVRNNSTLVSTSPDPLIDLNGSTVTTGLELIGLEGVATAVDAETGLLLGTDRPLRAAGPLVQAAGSSLTSQGLLRVDTALLEASAPLLILTAGSTLTSSADLINLVQRANLTANLLPKDALVKLNASTLNLTSGSLVNVAGGSYLKVTGDLLQMSGGSVLNISNGLLLNVSDGSSAWIKGALVNFSGFGNVINISNTLPVTGVLMGIPVFSSLGGTKGFTITGSPIIGLGDHGTININGISCRGSCAAAAHPLIAIQGKGGTIKIGP